MTLIQEFKEKVLSNETQFEILNGRQKLSFLKRTVGNAVYIFGDRIYGDDDFNLKSNFSVKAILSEGNIYIVDTFMFYSIENEACPDNIFSLSEKELEVNNIIEKDLFPKYYSNLPIRPLTEEERDISISKVRAAVLLNDSIIAEPKVKKLMNSDDIVKLLCGVFSIEGFAKNYFYEHKESYIKTKSINNELKSLIELKHNLNDWEIAMSSSLKELEAKTVTVEFNYNGEVGTEKVDKDTLLRMLYSNDYFSSFNFVNGRSGEALLEKLNVASWRNAETDVLECKHINSIKFGRKTIYFKNAI